jgi:SPP1 family predicted phage head-tail adaptor
MGIGARKKIELVRVVHGQGATGANENDPQDAVDTWAEITNPSGFRQYLNGQGAMEDTKDFLVRYDFTNQPNSSWRIVYDGKNWEIQNRIPIDEKKFYWRITATAKGDV